jgi:hypothetical protein
MTIMIVIMLIITVIIVSCELYSGCVSFHSHLNEHFTSRVPQGSTLGSLNLVFS